MSHLPSKLLLLCSSVLLMSALLLTSASALAADNIFNDDSLVGFYPFSGDMKDHSGNNRHGSRSGSPTLVTDRDGNPNSAYFFNGRSKINLYAFRHFVWGKGFTVSVWFKRQGQTGNYQGVISNGYYTNGSWEIRMGRESGGRYIFGHLFFPKSKWSTHLALNQWHHVLMSWNGTHLSTYINGKLRSRQGRSAGLRTKNNPITIGQAGVGTSREYFYGVIDDVRLYNRGLTQEEAEAIYHAEADSTLLDNAIIDEDMMDTLCDEAS